MDEAIPARIRLQKRTRSPGRAARAGVPAGVEGHRRPQPVVQVVYRARLLRLLHAECHSAERARESRLVHALHPVSGRDRPGPPRRVAQLSDDGWRPDRDADRDGVAAGRSHGGRRSDDDAASGAGKAHRRDRRPAAVLRRRWLLSADDRGAPLARRASRHRAGDRGLQEGRAVGSSVWRDRPDAGRSGEAPRACASSSIVRNGRASRWRSRQTCSA